MSLPALFGVVCALLLTLLSSVAHAVPTAEDKESARNLFRMGDEKYQAGDYDGALTSFKAADAIMRLPTTGLEVGRTLMKLNRLIEAREKLRSVAQLEPEDGEEDVQEAARDEARSLFKKLGDDIPSLQVRLLVPGDDDVEDFSVTVDGERLPSEAALLPRRVDPGKHRVVVEAEGYTTEERTVTLNISQAFVLEVELVREARGDGESPPDPAPRRPEAETSPEESASDGSGLMALSAVMFGVGGASLVVGACTGVFTLVEASELEESCPDKRCLSDEEDQLDKTVTLSHISTATLVAGGALVAVGLVALVVAATGDDGGPDAAFIVGPGFTGVRGTF